MGQFVTFSETNAHAVGESTTAVSRSQALLFLPTAILLGVTLIGAAIVAQVLDLTWIHLVPLFMLMAILVTLVVVMSAVFVQVCRLAKVMHPDPLGQVRSTWLRRPLLVRLLLPTVVAPIFMASFVTLKAAATTAIPYNWDRLLTNVDHMLFGVDPWIPLHTALNFGFIPDLLEFGYLGWQLLLPAALAAAAIWMKPRNLAVFFSAMFMTWIVAGVFIAAYMHSAGPIFAYIFDDQLGARFEPLSAVLLNNLDHDSRILKVHILLALSVGDPVVSRGGGISAMPSVHVAVTAIYLCAAWSRRYWRLAALLFAAQIWVGSVYFGYHYVTDGPVAFVIAIGCWFACSKWVDYLHRPFSAAPPFRTPLAPVMETESAGAP